MLCNHGRMAHLGSTPAVSVAASGALGRLYSSPYYSRVSPHGNCASCQFGADHAGQGHCPRYDIEAAPFVPFPCEGFGTSATPTAPAYLPDPDGVLARAGRA